MTSPLKHWAKHSKDEDDILPQTSLRVVLDEHDTQREFDATGTVGLQLMSRYDVPKTITSTVLPDGRLCIRVFYIGEDELEQSNWDNYAVLKTGKESKRLLGYAINRVGLLRIYNQSCEAVEDAIRNMIEDSIESLKKTYPAKEWHYELVGKVVLDQLHELISRHDCDEQSLAAERRTSPA